MMRSPWSGPVWVHVHPVRERHGCLWWLCFGWWWWVVKLVLWVALLPILAIVWLFRTLLRLLFPFC